MFQIVDFLGDFAEALPQIRFGSVFDLFVAETVARFMKLELGFQLGALGIQAMEVSVVHLTATGSS